MVVVEINQSINHLIQTTIKAHTTNKHSKRKQTNIQADKNKWKWKCNSITNSNWLSKFQYKSRTLRATFGSIYNKIQHFLSISRNDRSRTLQYSEHTVFDNGLTTSWPSWRTRSTTPPHRSTPAVTSNLSSSLVGFDLLLRHESANRLPEPTSLTVLFAAPLLLFGIH